MTAVDRVINDYKTTLSTLEKNDKLRINVLTILAADYAQHSQQIAKIIEESIFEAETVPLKLMRLYLMDSIVKNVKTIGNYADKFSDNLVKIFLHVFNRSDEKVRASLFKLRNTWQDVFPKGKLYMLDVEVHGVDPKWPIVMSQRNGSIQKAVKRPSEPEPEPIIKAKKSVEPEPITEVKKAAELEPKVKKSMEPEPITKARPKFIPAPAKAPPFIDVSVPPTRHFLPPPSAKTPPFVNVSIPPPVPVKTPPLIDMSLPPPRHVLPPARHFLPPPQVRNEAPRLPPQQIRHEAPRMPPPQIRHEAPRLPPPQIRNETPRLPNLPSNNRIFVDGKAYEVFYLDNIAVIERNGVPHRISFCGPPRDVIIDGIAHRMSFGEIKPVVIDGQTHYLKFGAPSRELYMGDFPFKGAFGGPAIAATINGRRHEIRLCGPPPEVKIEQDPCYELIRQMQNLRQNNAPNFPPPKKDEKEMNLGDLLNKLQKSGVLNSLGTALKLNEKASASSSAPVFPANIKREATPPIIPSNVKMDKFEVRESPTTSLSQFYMPDLKMRYLGVIKSIHQRGSTCPDCGIFFTNTNLPNYRNHLDEHIQIDINASTTIHPMGKSRQRYLNEEEWVLYSKVDQLNRTEPLIMENDSIEDEENSDMEE